MTPQQYALLKALAETTQSGPQLGQHLGISRAAVWKHIEQLRAMSIDIQAGEHGYSLPQGMDLLDADPITQLLPASTRRQITAIHILAETESTNQWLRSAAVPLHGRVCIAESQTAGRGRRGKQWYSPPCSNLYFSMAWQFDCGVGALGLLSTAIAVAAAQAIEAHCGAPLKLKWPNDLYLHDRKLGGILIELQATPDGPSLAIIGIGINVHLAVDAPIDQPFTSLGEFSSSIKRNHLAANLIEHLTNRLTIWPPDSSNELLQQWDKRDQLKGQNVVLFSADEQTVRGHYLGIDQYGGLKIRVDGTVHTYHSGEVSVRHDR